MVGAELEGEFELLIGHVDRGDLGTDQARILHGEVAEPADAEDCDAFTWDDFRCLDRSVCRDTGAGSGAASNGVTPSGTETAKRASASAYSGVSAVDG